MTGLPHYVSTRAYDAYWGNSEDRAEAAYVADLLFKLIPLAAGLEGAAFRDPVLNDMCAALAREIETRSAEIKRRGDL